MAEINWEKINVEGLHMYVQNQYSTQDTEELAEDIGYDELIVGVDSRTTD